MLMLCETGYEMTEDRLDVNMIVDALGVALAWVSALGFFYRLVTLKMLPNLTTLPHHVAQKWQFMSLGAN